VAELEAAFLSNEAGILSEVHFDNSAAYLASWVQRLESDSHMIVSAASQAQQAVNFILRSTTTKRKPRQHDRKSRTVPYRREGERYEYCYLFHEITGLT
jgi:antirestriction protein ArdC